MPGEGLLVEPRGTPLERWYLRPGPCGVLSPAPGWREASPAHLPVPAQPDLAQGTRTGLSGCCLFMGERKALTLRLSPVFSRPSPLGPFSSAAPSAPQLSSSAGVWAALRTEGDVVLSRASEGAQAG